MNENEFSHKVDETLWRIEEAVEALDTDIDFESGEGILTLAFHNNSRLIVSKQGAMKQLWVAAKSGGFHYAYDAGRHAWCNDQTGAELFSELSRLVSEQAGRALRLGLDRPA